MSDIFRFAAFEGVGVELEYMIVERESLSVASIAETLLLKIGEETRADGLLDWSNELVAHVVEVKNPRPLPSLAPLPAVFAAEIRRVNEMLAPLGARLMPTGMHPWMDPAAETRLWRGDGSAIYRTYDRIFGCKTHGWANVQSMHLNLPFAGDLEFARLHEAIRFILPILPAIAASSPIADAKAAGFMDSRMEVYGANAANIPSITGRVIPEPVSSRADYEARILAPMYRDIAPLDTDRVLRHEWLNSHGAIARFDRGAIEIRVIDMQECPLADIAIAAVASAVVKRLYQAEARGNALDTDVLARLLTQCIGNADLAVIDEREYLARLEFPDRRCQARELWQHLIETSAGLEESTREPLRLILERGPLARRIVQALGADFSRGKLHAVYNALCDCLEHGRMFTAAD